MSETDEIPHDVSVIAGNEALKYVEWLDPPPIEGVASAEHVLAASFARVILAERERSAEAARRHLEVCAQVAARSSLVGYAAEFYGAAKIEVPAAIRKSPQ